MGLVGNQKCFCGLKSFLIAEGSCPPTPDPLLFNDEDI